MKKHTLALLGLIGLAFVAFAAAGCSGSSDPAPVAGPAVGSPTPTGGTITADPVQGRKPRMMK